VRNQRDFSSQAPRNDNAFVTLKVYDVLGKEVATLVNEEKQAGVYEIEFDGRNLSSGVYFYKLTAGNYSQTKKMILLR
jgi:flagellar hook assembly protein FlgD